MRRPFWKKRAQCWYVKDRPGEGAKEIRLDPDEQVALEMWKDLLDASRSEGPNISFQALANRWAESNFKDTQKFRDSARRLKKFIQWLGPKRAMDLRKSDVQRWINDPKPGQKRADGTHAPAKEWGDRTKFDAAALIKQVYKWGVEEDFIPKSPIAGLKVDPGEPRSSIITPGMNVLILNNSSPEFRDYLEAAACGMRPRQIREVTAQHVLQDFSAWVFQDHKTRKKTKRALVVYLPEHLAEITRRLVEKHPDGPLFRNEQGNPWKKDTVAQKFRRLRDKIGIPKEVVSYSYRHTFATQALKKELPLQTVAELLGHKDTRMVSQVYGHLSKEKKYLQQAAQRAVQ